MLVFILIDIITFLQNIMVSNFSPLLLGPKPKQVMEKYYRSKI